MRCEGSVSSGWARRGIRSGWRCWVRHPRPRLGTVARRPRDAFCIDPSPQTLWTGLGYSQWGWEHGDHTFNKPVVVVSERKSCHDLKDVVCIIRLNSIVEKPHKRVGHISACEVLGADSVTQGRNGSRQKLQTAQSDCACIMLCKNTRWSFVALVFPVPACHFYFAHGTDSIVGFSVPNTDTNISRS